MLWFRVTACERGTRKNNCVQEGWMRWFRVTVCERGTWHKLMAWQSYPTLKEAAAPAVARKALGQVRSDDGWRLLDFYATRPPRFRKQGRAVLNRQHHGAPPVYVAKSLRAKAG